MKGLRITEYDVAPGSAPLFLVGELWAALHERCFQLHSLNPGDFQISRAGVARLAPGAKLNATVELEPEDAAADLARALSRYSADDAAALLAGYTRLGLELLDLRRPGYTIALLERLQPEKPWPRPLVAPISPAVMRDLGVELLVVGRVPSLVVTRDSNLPRLWQYGLREAFLLILGFLVAGVDCRALFDRDRERSRRHPAPLLYQLLWPNAEPIAEGELHRVAQEVPEIELAIGLAQALRGERLAEPFNFNDVIAWVGKVLTVDVHQATLLGDVLSQCARHCASLMVSQGGPASEAESYLQKAIIMLEYSCRGYPSDEERLISMTRSLYELPGYPKPLERGHGSLNLGVWNSLLLTYRALAERSSSHRKESLTGLLRSSMTRGIWAARHQLRRTYATAMSQEPKVALHGHVFLRMTVKSYATLLTGLWESAEDDLRVTGTSAWSPLFGTSQVPGPLALEAMWISNFLQAAAQDGFSLEVARAFMNQGAKFITDDQSSA